MEYIGVGGFEAAESVLSVVLVARLLDGILSPTPPQLENSSCAPAERQAGGKQANWMGDTMFKLSEVSVNQRLDWRRLTHKVNATSALQRRVCLLGSNLRVPGTQYGGNLNRPMALVLYGSVDGEAFAVTRQGLVNISIYH